jgi:acetylglutamate kinase
VGRVKRANPELLDLLAANRFVPVVACVAGDRAGNIYNVNADQMAVACAAGFEADRLIFLTDVEGVMDAARQILPVLTAAGGERLIAEGVATGDVFKLNAAIAEPRGGGEVRSGTKKTANLKEAWTCMALEEGVTA